MSCRGFVQILLKILNFLLTLVGLAMIGYGIYMLVRWHQHKHTTVAPPLPPTLDLTPPAPPVANLSFSPVLTRLSNSLAFKGREMGSEDAGSTVLQPRRALLLKVPIHDGQPSFFKHLPSSWFICLFIAIGVIICLITCSGYIAAGTTNRCGLSCYIFFLGVLIALEFSLAAFIYFNHDWQKDVPDDPTGQVDNVVSFIRKKFDICKWVALAGVIVEVIAMLLSVSLCAMGSSPRTEYDSDDEYLAPRSSVRQPLLNRQGVAGAAVSPTGSESRVTRTDTWSTRMREKYGLDTTEFSYNLTDSKRFAPKSAPVEEQKSRCTIM